MGNATLQVYGLDCAEEVALLRAQLMPMSGVQELSFDILRGRMTVEFDELQIQSSMLIDEVRKTGMRAVECRDDTTPRPQNGNSDQRYRIALTTCSGLLGLTGCGLQFWLTGWQASIFGDQSETPILIRGLYLASAISGLWLAFPKVISAILRIRPDMNLLMTVAVIGAFAIGEYSEAATVSFLFSLSLALESWSVDRARRAIESLMSLAPTTACRLNIDGTEQRIPAAEVAVGNTILVRPGEKFPLDGRITKGDTTVNQAPITGESIPVQKSPGNPVFAGTINEDGAVEVETSKTADDSTLAHILRLVSEAQRKRSVSEQSVETFARYYTPAIMVLSLLVMLLPPLVFCGKWAFWFYQGLVLLVIACPCGLVISTPVSIIATLTSAAKQGVLVKGGRFLELAAQLRAIAFDKTGTLTIGRPEVKQVIPLNGFSNGDLLSIASSVESMSQHPFAQSIVRYTMERNIHYRPATDFQSLQGRGATANVDGRQIWIGSFVNLEERGHADPELRAQVDRHFKDGESLVAVGNDERLIGLIALSDPIRSSAKETMAALRQAGIRHLVMLTGDNPKASAVVAEATGVDKTLSELLPHDKVAAVEDLVRDYRIVAMVGDGVNDAPAMAKATLGIAMGQVGTDSALETADVVLMNDDLSRIIWLIIHARRMRAIIRQNITSSLLVKAGFAGLTIAGYASLWSAIAADTGMSLIVVMNALRLLTTGPEQKSDNHGVSCGCHRRV